ncbi:hypothetical protein C8F04DRAFT_1190968 [Mycena alexandri]|uniref:Uncharacterized protein n=1 Tax=Mycena alexandri TaxID=1745969 RepID=A0AAD6SI58_9AGAR|nr:hypothetical protein C8F04DRAFT_1190968 [Mycena alexandri]
MSVVDTHSSCVVTVVIVVKEHYHQKTWRAKVSPWSSEEFQELCPTSDKGESFERPVPSCIFGLWTDRQSWAYRTQMPGSLTIQMMMIHSIQVIGHNPKQVQYCIGRYPQGTTAHPKSRKRTMVFSTGKYLWETFGRTNTSSSPSIFWGAGVIVPLDIAALLVCAAILSVRPLGIAERVGMGTAWGASTMSEVELGLVLVFKDKYPRESAKEEARDRGSDARAFIPLETSHFKSILKKYRFDFDIPSGIENIPADWAKLVAEAQDALTQRRSMSSYITYRHRTYI